jgi:hypothetical protein
MHGYLATILRLLLAHQPVIRAAAERAAGRCRVIRSGELPSERLCELV